LLLRRGLRLEYATLAWNVFGSALVLAAAVAARSVASANARDLICDSVLHAVGSLSDFLDECGVRRGRVG